MGSLSSIWIKKEVLETLLKTVTSKGQKGVSIDVSISDKVNDYGQNVSSYVSQTKEQRDENKTKYYVGNGKVFWTDGKIIAPPKDAPKASAKDGEADNLPF